MQDTIISSVDGLYNIYKEPTELVQKKQLDRLDVHCRNFIALSPFLVLGTYGDDGTADASPRGDAAGFVKVVDDHTLLLPDRPGNNRLDTMINIIHNPAVGLLFMVPGINETLRVNGDAVITTDPELLAEHAINEKLPTSILKISVKAAYLHCAKALIRSRLWAPETQVERSSFPSLGKIIADQIGNLDADEADRRLAESYKNRLY
ncbi:pyridoxamine 5'-phosphate oxidase family protein [Sneathiella sp.]|uniref:pyridoxamine 5'-phosphate oxidase family protein n=1 Tax=Sneathiella sp. TaxID=1964365 RepID=UPI00356483EC